MKKYSVIAALFMMIVCLAACVPTEKTDIQMAPDFSTSDKVIDLDFTQIHNDTIGSFGEVNPYVYIEDLDISGDNSSKVVNIKATSLDGIEEADAKQFVAACMRYINDAAVVQDSKYQVSDSTTFGNLWDSFSMHAVVTSHSGETVLDMTVEKGTEAGLNPDIETYEEEWEKAVEIYNRNHAGED